MRLLFKYSCHKLRGNASLKLGKSLKQLKVHRNFVTNMQEKAGFTARLFNSKKTLNTNEIIWKQFVCYNEGDTDDKIYINK